MPNELHESEYHSWYDMKRRCYDSRHVAFKYYGGRGIVVCERWRQSFATFMADMGHKPDTMFTIDRKDPNGNYEPANCQWLAKAEQWTTTRARMGKAERSDHWEYVAQVCRAHGLPVSVYRQRLRSGWDPERAASQPIPTRSRDTFLKRSTRLAERAPAGWLDIASVAALVGKSERQVRRKAVGLWEAGAPCVVAVPLAGRGSYKYFVDPSAVAEKIAA
jgi:hypothetical protein